MEIVDKILLNLNDAGILAGNPSYMAHNLSNISYRISFDGKDAVLKVFLSGLNPRTALTKEVRGMKIAKTAGLPVPELYFCSDLLECPFYLVREFIAGESVMGSYHSLKEHRYDIIKKSGKTLAILHSARTEEFKDESERNTKPYNYLETIKKETQALAKQSENEGLYTLVEKFLPYFSQQYVPKEDICFIHGDYKFSNILTNGTSKIVGIIDWEHSGYGLAIEDIGRVCVFPAEVVAAFLKGYNAKSPTLISEVDLLKDLFYIRTMARFFMTKHKPNINPKRVAEFEPHLNQVLTELLAKYK